MKLCVALLAVTMAGAACAAALPYDDHADARAAIQHTLAAARTDHRPVLVIFGANWCEDCRALDTAMHAGSNAMFIAQYFNVVKVDVGDFNRNLDISAAYGDPIKSGIPAAVIVSADNQVLYATRAGELADARHMSDSGIHEFFKSAAQKVETPR